MITKNKIFNLIFIYIFFIFLSLIIFFFSTTKAKGKGFEIKDIEISQPFEMNFNKARVIDDGFKKAFLELISLIVNSSDQKKINKIKLNEIKGMIDSFSIKEEEFIDEIYYVNLGVSFNKKRVFNYLEKKNIFPSNPSEKKILFIPIIIDENKKDLLIFDNNEFFDEWNNIVESYHLIEYILPTEDLEDLNIVERNYEIIEEYDFKEIINKYSLEDAVVTLIFKNKKDLRILSKIYFQNKVILKNQSFIDIDMDNIDQIHDVISSLKVIYEDYWKDLNQINTSIRLSLKVKINNSNNEKILKFEDILDNTDLIYDYSISKFDQNFIYFNIVFNGTPDSFLESMNENNFNFDTQNQIWVLK